MTRPNFFIVGAPKCGTTALSEYLKGHPSVFICEPKEPNYFSFDFRGLQYVRDEKAYVALFGHATSSQTRIGEASVSYLYSREALPAVKQFVPDAQIIVMVRNPVNMAISLHRQLVYAGYEDVHDFEEAWRLQESRRNGLHIPPNCREEAFLQYAEVCSLGTQLQRLHAVFPSEQIKVILFDDFVRDTRGVYREVLDLLGLPDDARENFPLINEAKRPRYEMLSKVIARGKPWVVRVALQARDMTGWNPFPWLRRLESINQIRVEKYSIRWDFCKEMLAAFKEDIALLSSLIERDLSCWQTICEVLPGSPEMAGLNEKPF